jgi:type I restriction enzyme S subunit
VTSAAWQRVRLGDYCSKIGSGSTPRGGESVYKESGVSLIRSQNVYNGQFDMDGLAYLDDEHADQLKGVIVESGDVLLNITGDSVARSCRVPDDVLPARVNQHVAIVRPKPAEFDSRFVGYFFISPFMQETMLSLAGSGGTRKALTKELIERFEIPKPPRPVQERIADILSAYDELIENNGRRMTLLQEAARQLYREWFVRLRFPGHEHTGSTNGVPDGWTAGVVSDFYVTASGGTPSRKRQEYFTGEIPWVKTQELANSFVIDTSERITEDGLNNSSARLFPARTVLVALYGATVGELGILATPAATNQACCAVMPRDLRAHYIHAFLFLSENKEGLRSLSAGAAQKNISQEIIRNFRMVLPPKSVMDVFVESLTSSFNQWLNLERQNAKLRAARDVLLPRLMNGKIAV